MVKKMSVAQTLIVSPHMDDEVLGRSSFLQEHAHSVLVVYVTRDHASVDNDTLRTENEDLIKWLGCRANYPWFTEGANSLDAYGLVGFVDEFQRIFNEAMPQTVLLPSPSYNQDHRVVYEAALTALRPHDHNHFVKRVLLYEQPETFGTLRKPAPFEPTYFRPLDIAFKHVAVEFYKSQLRGHRSLQHLEHIAGVRGMQSGMDYAEAFQVVRWVD